MCILSGGCLSSDSGVIDQEKTNSSQIVMVTDSTNNIFFFPHPCQRIVALNLDTIETLVVLGAGDKIVGVPDNILTKSNLGKYIPNAVSIGDSGGANIEKIAQLKPDVIIIMSSSQGKQKSQLQNLGVPILSFNCYILSDIPHSVKNLGTLTGEIDNASAYLDFYTTYNMLISEKTREISPEEKPDVYLEIGNDYTAAGEGSGGDSLLQNIGVHNIASHLPTQWPTVSPEWIIQSNPDVMIKTVHTYVGEQKNFPKIYNGIVNRSGFHSIKAYYNSRIYVITSNILYGPKCILGQLYLGKIFYPKRFSDIQPDEIVQQYEKLFGVSMNESEIIYPKPL